MTETWPDVETLRPIGWTGPTGVRVAAHVRVWSPLDNHTPTRSDVTCTLEQYEWPVRADGFTGNEYRIPGGLDLFPQGDRALWLLDDGTHVTVLYCTGYHPAKRYIGLKSFPAGLVGGFGPRRTYHLMIQEITA